MEVAFLPLRKLHAKDDRHFILLTENSRDVRDSGHVLASLDAASFLPRLAAGDLLRDHFCTPPKQMEMLQEMLDALCTPSGVTCASSHQPCEVVTDHLTSDATVQPP